MKIAIPTRNGHVDDHFGHCAEYTIVDISDNKIVSQQTLPSPQGCGCKSNIASTLQQMGVTMMLAYIVFCVDYFLLVSSDKSPSGRSAKKS